MKEFLEEYADKVDERGRRQVVRNGYLPARTILTGTGPLEIKQSRIRDKSPGEDGRAAFASAILPPYLRTSRSIEELLPWLYLKGVSTSDYAAALQSLLGIDAKGLSPNVLVRLKETWGQEFKEWCRRDLFGEEYVEVCADGIHVNVRLEDEGNQKHCLFVLMGAAADGRKELIAVIVGVRESKQSSMELLLDLKKRGLTYPPRERPEAWSYGSSAWRRQLFWTPQGQRGLAARPNRRSTTDPSRTPHRHQVKSAGLRRCDHMHPKLAIWKSGRKRSAIMQNARAVPAKATPKEESIEFHGALHAALMADCPSSLCLWGEWLESIPTVRP